ncbi:MAG: hypothetical protein ACTSRE_04460 [Promethearchaeota archaeon]
MSDQEVPPNVLRLKLKIVKSENKIARILQIIARIIAGIGTVAAIGFLGLFFALFLLYGSFIGLIFIALIFVSAWFYTLSLKDELMGGILMICESIGFVLYLVLFVKWIAGWDLFVTLIITIPLAVSGFLYLAAWYLEKYKKRIINGDFPKD